MSQLTDIPVVGLTQILLLVGTGLLFIIAIFGVLAVLICMLNYQENPVRNRLRTFREKGVFQRFQQKSDPFGELREALITFAGPVSQNLYGQNVKYRKQVKSILTEAGLPDTDERIDRFLAQRVATGIVLGAVGFVLIFSLTFGDIIFGIFAVLAGFVGGSMIPQYALRRRAALRKAEIRNKMPDTLDLMVVCVEAGLGLDTTIQRVAEETETMTPEISQEFRRLNKELSAGLSRLEAFQNMGQRTGVDEMRSLCAMIVQADKMGTSIADTLRIYADDLRTRRRQRAEELAAKASIKMTFPLVLFIFPPLFIILIGPVIITTLKSFGMA